MRTLWSMLYEQFEACQACPNVGACLAPVTDKVPTFRWSAMKSRRVTLPEGKIQETVRNFQDFSRPGSTRTTIAWGKKSMGVTNSVENVQPRRLVLLRAVEWSGGGGFVVVNSLQLYMFEEENDK